jgi:hypothetical protein
MTSLCARCVGGRELASAFVLVLHLLLLPSLRLLGRVLHNSAWCLHPRLPCARGAKWAAGPNAGWTSTFAPHARAKTCALFTATCVPRCIERETTFGSTGVLCTPIASTCSHVSTAGSHSTLPSSWPHTCPTATPQSIDARCAACRSQRAAVSRSTCASTPATCTRALIAASHTPRGRHSKLTWRPICTRAALSRAPTAVSCSSIDLACRSIDGKSTVSGFLQRALYPCRLSMARVHARTAWCLRHL